jgi:hypothetical protein
MQAYQDQGWGKGSRVWEEFDCHAAVACGACLAMAHEAEKVSLSGKERG